MSPMKPIVEIGLPELDEERIGQLAEQCEQEISKFIFDRIPQKSIEELSVSCSLNLTDILDLDIMIEITQKYDTGINLDDVIESASDYGSMWLEKRLMELKTD